MKERIITLKNLYKSDVTSRMFYDLILNCRNGYNGDRMVPYANIKSIPDWIDLYSKVGINVNEGQLEQFFNYLKEHYARYFGSMKDKEDNILYYVNRDFEIEAIQFKFENTVFIAFEVLDED